MKIFSLLIFGLVITGTASQEWRTFTSADGERTFKGQLTAFDSDSETVTVLNTRMDRISFNMELLSEDDRNFVTENSSKLPPDANLRIRFEPVSEQTKMTRGGGTRTSTKNGGYTIYVNSYSPQTINYAKVEYVLIYRKDQVKGYHSNKVVKGSETVVIPSNSSATVHTDLVNLVSYTKRGSVSSSRIGGGCSGGRCGGSRSSTTVSRGERSRDFLIGCVARVIVDGHVVSVSATSPGTLEKYESELGDSYAQK